jgi:hypothetical protein
MKPRTYIEYVLDETYTFNYLVLTPPIPDMYMTDEIAIIIFLGIPPRGCVNFINFV